jgi:hypothetical protein
VIYSPVKKVYYKYNDVFVKEYKFGFLSLELKKSTDTNEDAYYKEFLDIIKDDSSISEKLWFIKVALSENLPNVVFHRF